MTDPGPQLSLVVLRVSDLDASRSFYERLGLQLRTEQHGTGPRHLSADLGGTVIELYPVGSGPSTLGLRLGFAVSDLGAVVAQAGGSVAQDAERDGIRVVVITDPDGHKVELTELVGDA